MTDRKTLKVIAESIRDRAATSKVEIDGDIITGRAGSLSISLGLGWSESRRLVRFANEMEKLFPNVELLFCGGCSGPKRSIASPER